MTAMYDISVSTIVKHFGKVASISEKLTIHGSIVPNSIY